MKKIILILLLSVVIASAHQQNVNTVGMVLYYKLWENNLTTTAIFDYALKNANGGIEGLINAQSGSVLDDMWDNGGSVAIWLRPESQGPTNDGRVLDKSKNGAYGWRLYCDGSDTKLTFEIVTDACDGNWTFAFDMTGDKWQHVAIVYNSDFTTNNPIVYVNGILVAVTETTTPSGTRRTDAEEALVVGSEASGGNYYDGSMGDIMLFDIPLNVAAARSIYELTRSRYSK